MQSMKESAANAAASAKAGMDKTKATLQEKEERMTADNPEEKRMATERKEEKKAEAEWRDLQARQQNAASKLAAKGGADARYTTVGRGPTSASETGSVT